jgi:hypothetical protein
VNSSSSDIFKKRIKKLKLAAIIYEACRVMCNLSSTYHTDRQLCLEDCSKGKVGQTIPYNVSPSSDQFAHKSNSDSSALSHRSFLVCLRQTVQILLSLEELVFVHRRSNLDSSNSKQASCPAEKGDNILSSDLTQAEQELALNMKSQVLLQLLQEESNRQETLASAGKKGDDAKSSSASLSISSSSHRLHLARIATFLLFPLPLQVLSNDGGNTADNFCVFDPVSLSLTFALYQCVLYDSRTHGDPTNETVSAEPFKGPHAGPSIILAGLLSSIFEQATLGLMSQIRGPSGGATVGVRIANSPTDHAPPAASVHQSTRAPTAVPTVKRLVKLFCEWLQQQDNESLDVAAVKKLPSATVQVERNGSCCNPDTHALAKLLFETMPEERTTFPAIIKLASQLSYLLKGYITQPRCIYGPKSIIPIIPDTHRFAVQVTQLLQPILMSLTLFIAIIDAQYLHGSGQNNTPRGYDLPPFPSSPSLLRSTISHLEVSYHHYTLQYPIFNSRTYREKSAELLELLICRALAIQVLAVGALCRAGSQAQRNDELVASAVAVWNADFADLCHQLLFQCGLGENQSMHLQQLIMLFADIAALTKSMQYSARACADTHLILLESKERMQLPLQPLKLWANPLSARKSTDLGDKLQSVSNQLVDMLVEPSSKTSRSAMLDIVTSALSVCSVGNTILEGARKHAVSMAPLLGVVISCLTQHQTTVVFGSMVCRRGTPGAKLILNCMLSQQSLHHHIFPSAALIWAYFTCCRLSFKVAVEHWVTSPATPTQASSDMYMFQDRLVVAIFFVLTRLGCSRLQCSRAELVISVVWKRALANPYSALGDILLEHSTGKQCSIAQCIIILRSIFPSAAEWNPRFRCIARQEQNGLILLKLAESLLLLRSLVTVRESAISKQFCPQGEVDRFVAKWGLLFNNGSRLSELEALLLDGFLQAFRELTSQYLTDFILDRMTIRILHLSTSEQWHSALSTLHALALPSLATSRKRPVSPQFASMTAIQKAKLAINVHSLRVKVQLGSACCCVECAAAEGNLISLIMQDTPPCEAVPPISA